MVISMTAMKQSRVTGDQKTNDRRTSMLKVFEEFETENYASSSDDSETYSPKSVVTKVRKWPATMKDVNVRRVRNQIERIRAEDSHLGEDLGECLIAMVSSTTDHDLVDVMNFSRPASPLSGKVSSGGDKYRSVNTFVVKWNELHCFCCESGIGEAGMGMSSIASHT
ncbi:hypothetical protein LXL04_024066 [Taraxacum kok-saghyz]